MVSARRSRTAAGLIVALVLVAAPPAIAGPGVRDFDLVGPSVKPVYLPQVGVVSEVALGESIVTAFSVYSREALRLKDPVRTKGTGYKLTIPQGVLMLVGKSDDGKFYESRESIDLVTFGIVQAGTHGGIFLPNDHAASPETYWGSSTKAVVAPAPGVTYDLTTRESAGRDSFKMELLYSGVFQNTLTLTYREFKNDLARPAFTQELKYDLSQGDEIGFRSARFRVLKATNTGLSYQVISPLTR